MSVSTDIKQHIIANIQSCGSVDKVYGHEELNPKGWPAVMVSPGNMDGEFSSTAENSRIYSFRVLIIFPLGQDFPSSVNMNRVEYAEQVVATVIDEMINVFDTDFELVGSNPAVLYVNAADVAWMYYNYEGGKARGAELTLRVYTEKTVVGA